MTTKDQFSMEEVIKTVGQATKEIYGVNPYEKKEKTLDDYETDAEKIAYLNGESAGIRFARRLINEDAEKELASFAPNHD